MEVGSKFRFIPVSAGKEKLTHRFLRLLFPSRKGSTLIPTLGLPSCGTLNTLLDSSYSGRGNSFLSTQGYGRVLTEPP